MYTLLYEEISELINKNPSGIQETVILTLQPHWVSV
jgi:hypothetical protein